MADDEEGEVAGAGIRSVQMSLRRCLRGEQAEREAITASIERLVRSVSKAMHHGSQLATHYALVRMERGDSLTEAELLDQAFWRNCMTYCRTDTSKGKYGEVKELFDRNADCYPFLRREPYDAAVVNQAARKLRAAVLTMLSRRFYQRVATVVGLRFSHRPASERDSITKRAQGLQGGRPTVLGREEWRFAAAVQGVLFAGVSFVDEAAADVVSIFGRAVPKASKPEVARQIVEGREVDAPRVGPLLRVAAGAASAVCAIIRAGGDLSPEAVASRLLPGEANEAARSRLAEAIRAESAVGLKGVEECRATACIVVMRPVKRATVAWLKRHPAHGLRATELLLREMDTHLRGMRKAGKTERRACFPLLPVFRQARQFVTINRESLEVILRKAGVLAKAAPLDSDVIQSVFAFPKNRAPPSGGKFSFETDGYAIVLRTAPGRCASTMKPKALDPNWNSGGGEVTTFVSVDPGFCNIATVHKESADGASETHRFTSKEFYSASGSDRRLSERRRKDLAIKGEREVLRSTTLLVASSGEFEEALKTRLPVCGAVWEHNLGMWTSVLRLKSYSGRRRALDRFWARKVGLSPRNRASTAIAYGDGRLGSHGRKRYKSVPTKAMKVSAARYGILVSTPERYSTKVCSSCGSPTAKVRMRLPMKRRGETVLKPDGSPELVLREVQGLRRCCSDVCSATRLKPRDVDAAKSIMQIFRAEENPRPECYTQEGYEARKRGLEARGILVD